MSVKRIKPTAQTKALVQTLRGLVDEASDDPTAIDRIRALHCPDEHWTERQLIEHAVVHAIRVHEEACVRPDWEGGAR